MADKVTGIPCCALTGHTTASVGRKYGDGVPLEVLAEAVAKVSYRGLDLSQLHGTQAGRVIRSYSNDLEPIASKTPRD